MDLIFKRYSSPFLFLDILIENNNLVKGIEELYHQKNEERWWEMYLATLPMNDKSFDDWRREAQKGQPTNSSNSLTKSEIEVAKNKAENILSNFNPYK